MGLIPKGFSKEINNPESVCYWAYRTWVAAELVESGVGFLVFGCRDGDFLVVCGFDLFLNRNLMLVLGLCHTERTDSWVVASEDPPEVKS